MSFLSNLTAPASWPPSVRGEVARLRCGKCKLTDEVGGQSQTLRRWHDTFNANWSDIADQGFDEWFRRMWNFYLTSCAAAFAVGNCDVTQITVKRPA